MSKVPCVLIYYLLSLLVCYRGFILVQNSSKLCIIHVILRERDSGLTGKIIVISGKHRVYATMTMSGISIPSVNAQWIAL